MKKSGVEGSAFDEAKAINQSLTILGRCIEILASNKKERPPFRESKLTRLLSNAIGGAAKTTLVVCVAPTMTDQFETVNSLEFGQQAMNVVVRARVNASTDFSSLCASLMAQRDAKQKPIHQLEMKVMQELQPQLDEVIRLELECKEAELGLQAHCPNAPMPHCPDIPMPNAPMPQCPNAPMPQYHNATMPQCHNAPMPQCPNAPMPNAPMPNAPMPQCRCMPSGARRHAWSSRRSRRRG